MPFTPLPNDFIDRIMPTLKDTEWRLLCVIARQTIGWRDMAGMPKERDWLTQKQLKERTGRDSAALSQAVAVLIERRLIVVSDAAGKPIASAKARHATRGRVYFGLHPEVLSATVPKSELVSGEKSTNDTHFSGIERRFSQNKARKANWTKENETKETLTKEVAADVFFENAFSQAPQTQLDLNTDTVELVNPEVERFIEHYKVQFKERIGTASPVVLQSDRQRLQALLNTYSFEALAELLEVFFRIDFGYIRRQGYSLSTFACSVNILKAIQPKFNQANNSAQMGAWHQAAGTMPPQSMPKGAHE